MIIDGEADFRSLLIHHVTTHWPDAVITEFDPTESGHLPDEFSGAGNDMVLLGNALGKRDGVETFKRFVKTPGFPAAVYFGDVSEEAAIRQLGADGFFVRDAIRHDALIVRLSDIYAGQNRMSSTGTLFMGDQRIGISPLIRGYRFIRKLGATEHSAVYLAEKESIDLKVVLKVLRQVPDVDDSVGAFDRFLQEYELIAELDHPNIVKIYDLGVGDDHAHIAMEYLDGGDLKRKLAVGINTPKAVRYFEQITGALGEIHKVGILHRDLKPGNIMLRSDDSIALIDFGLAKRMRLKMEITDSGEIFGTPYYMSPEQGHGNGVDLRSDLYSLGIIFFEMLTGEKPFKASSAMGIIYQHAKAPIPLLPPRLSQYQVLINMLLAKDPDNRMQSAEEILEWM
jgi:eukaryotic-like serine/threonine-protein kinase